MGVTPLFIFSLPRSGSTLLQRLIASHPAVSTTSEPWLLLPLLHMLRPEGTYSTYGHQKAVIALKDYAAALPGGDAELRAVIHDTVLDLYGRASRNSSSYFLDKTPRYHVISREIMELFPEGRFIFLWRNPLATVASMLERTAPGGRWNLYLRRFDLYDGLEQLVATWREYGEQAAAIRFEDLIAQPEKTMRQVCDYLELPYRASLLEDFSKARPPGHMGDVSKYVGLSTEPLDKWKSILANPIRVYWARRYLRRIDRQLQVMGYSPAALQSDLDEIPLTLRYVVSDLIRGSYGVVWSLFEPHLFKAKLARGQIHRALGHQ